MKNPFASIARLISRIRESWADNNDKAKKEQILDSFYIEEKKGSVYIMHNGTAIDIILGDSETAQDIVDRLNECRGAAIRFEYGTKTIQE